MKTSQTLKGMIIALIAITMPVSQAYPAVTEIHVPIQQYQIVNDFAEQGGDETAGAFDFNMPFTSPLVQAAATFIQRLDHFQNYKGKIAENVIPNEIPVPPVPEEGYGIAGLTFPADHDLDGLQSISLPEDIAQGKEEEDRDKAAGGFITGRRVLVTTGLLLMAGLIIGLLALGGGGGGSGSGSGGSGGGGGSDNGILPLGGILPGDGDGDGDGLGGGDGGNNNGEGIPLNPEPSTLLLFALGLLLPLLRRKSLS